MCIPEVKRGRLQSGTSKHRRVQVKSCICNRLAWIYRYYYTCCLQLLGTKCHLLPAALTFERSDSGDSSMWRSSELSISSSMPVIFPARLRCMAWIRGNRRSPAHGRRIQNEHSNSRKAPCAFDERQAGRRASTQHLLLFMQRGGSQHGGGQWLLPLDDDSGLRRKTQRIQSSGTQGGGAQFHSRKGRSPTCCTVTCG